MGKRAKLYGRAYAESLGCLKSDTTEEVGRTKLTNTKKEESLKYRGEKETSPSFPQILRKLRALPVGKLQSSFNVAGSWADMVGWKYENMKISELKINFVKIRKCDNRNYESKKSIERCAL